MKTKEEIRKEFFNKRLGLNKGLKKDFDNKVFKNVSGFFDFKMRSRVGIYIPIKNEVDTAEIIGFLLGENLKVYIPKFLKGNKKYSFVEFGGYDKLKKGKFNTSEPLGESGNDTANFDFIFVPGIAFSRDGFRLGYGSGIYDDLLKTSKTIKVGLAYEFQLLDKLPSEAHDIRMDFVVTEKSCYEAT